MNLLSPKSSLCCNFRQISKSQDNVLKQTLDHGQAWMPRRKILLAASGRPRDSSNPRAALHSSPHCWPALEASALSKTACTPRYAVTYNSSTVGI